MKLCHDQDNADKSVESSEAVPTAAKADQTTEVATDKADSAESSEATPEAAKADQTNQDNADNSAEPSEATPEAAKADQTTQDNADKSVESSKATPEAEKADQTTQDNADRSVEPSEANPEAAKFSALLTNLRLSVLDTTVVHQPYILVLIHLISYSLEMHTPTMSSKHTPYNVD